MKRRVRLTRAGFALIVEGFPIGQLFTSGQNSLETKLAGSILVQAVLNQSPPRVNYHKLANDAYRGILLGWEDQGQPMGCIACESDMAGHRSGDRSQLTDVLLRPVDANLRV